MTCPQGSAKSACSPPSVCITARDTAAPVQAARTIEARDVATAAPSWESACGQRLAGSLVGSPDVAAESIQRLGGQLPFTWSNAPSPGLAKQVVRSRFKFRGSWLYGLGWTRVAWRPPDRRAKRGIVGFRSPGHLWDGEPDSHASALVVGKRL